MKIIWPKRVEYYESIEDMPIRNWFKINETNDLKWVAKDLKVDAEKNYNILLTAWNKIFDEFLDTFGLPERMKEIMEIKRNIFVLQCQLDLSGDRTKLVFIKIEQDKLNKLIGDDKKSSTMEVQAYVEKYMSFKINAASVSVKEFYSYLSIMQKEIKANARR